MKHFRHWGEGKLRAGHGRCAGALAPMLSRGGQPSGLGLGWKTNHYQLDAASRIEQQSQQWQTKQRLYGLDPPIEGRSLVMQ
jgi:hypothetical protein